jgi:hypothetical protein
MSVKPVLSPFPAEASFTSAKNSGKLLKQTARSVSNPSLSSLLSGLAADASTRRARRLSHCGCKVERVANEASARNVYLCKERLISEINDESVLEKSVTRGARRVLHAAAKEEASRSGVRSVKRSCSAYNIETFSSV